MPQRTEVPVTEYFDILRRMRNHYGEKIHDQYLLFTMLVLEDFFEDHIINIAANETKLFHFTKQQILSMEHEYARK